MDLVDQQAAITNPGQSFRQGQANYVLYRLAVTENATLSQCNGSAGALPASTCIFNDITSGNNAVPGELNYGLSNAKYQAGVGYDLAAGLGSVNVENLVSQWSTVTFNPTTTVLELNGGSAVNVSHSQSVPVNVAVTPSSGTLVPTGDVVLYAASGPIGSPSGQTALNLFTLASGAVSGSTSMLPGGTYNVTAHYSGDATYAPSDSAVVSVVVTPEPSTTTFSVLSFDAFGNPTTFTTGPFGSFVYLRADVAGVSGIGNPSGSVTFQDAGNPVAGATALALNNQGNTATPNGILSFDAGTHTMSASYSGDASFNPSNSTQSQSFTITPGFFAAIPSNQANVVISAPGSSGQTSVTVSSSTGFSGTIKLACSGLPSESICTFSPASITASGTPKTMTASITITTKAATAVLDSEPRNYLLAQWMIGTGLMLSIGLVGGRGHGGRRHGGRGYGSRGFFFMLALALVIAVPGCGGGGGSNTKAPPPDPGTPTGFSTIVVTATSGSTVSRTSFALIVQ